jgi:uncharacterized protein (DUF305 family)
VHLCKFRSILSFAVATASIVVVACGPSAGGAPAPGGSAPTVAANPTSPAAAQPTATVSTTTAAPTLESVSFDQQFIDMMVPHHEGALAMARVAQSRAERPEIRPLAEDILRSQDAEISRMRQWRQDWFGSPGTPLMSKMPMLGGMAGMDHAGQTMDMARDVDRLNAAGGPFDVAFIDAMIPHHQSAIEAARLALQQSKRSEILDLAAGILEAQQREIGQMRAWRLAWSQATGPAAVATPAPGGTHDMTMPGQGTREVPGEDMNH